MLFCLSLLQELIGLNTSLTSLFGFRAREPYLEDLDIIIIKYSPKTLGTKHLHYLFDTYVPEARDPSSNESLSAVNAIFMLVQQGQVHLISPLPSPGSPGLTEVSCPSIWV